MSSPHDPQVALGNWLRDHPDGRLEVRSSGNPGERALVVELYESASREAPSQAGLAFQVTDALATFFPPPTSQPTPTPASEPETAPKE